MTFGRLVTTRVMPAEILVRSFHPWFWVTCVPYLFRGGRLYLSLMADSSVVRVRADAEVRGGRRASSPALQTVCKPPAQSRPPNCVISVRSEIAGGGDPVGAIHR